ncbi:galactose oxidase [Gigaspora margarita]|uniref:Galactose oxidase n=1 Tax=Gigaspora margarita TaxID=4874 RepID=A0A8H3XEW7_GIGMA|nr:galactose oxidase [Gigaspora margarita]
MKWFQKIDYLFFTLNLISSLVFCQAPSSRWELVSTLVGDKLYFFGGWVANNTASDEVWYIDLSIPFNTATPPWSKTTNMPVGYNFGSAIYDNDMSSVYLIGGNAFLPNTPNFTFGHILYAFDTVNSQWSTPDVKFDAPFYFPVEMPAVYKSGKVYAAGGKTALLSDKNQTVINNLTLILDVASMTWSTSLKIPFAPIDHTATLLPNGLIVHIGGYTFPMINMSLIQIFDTNTLSWSTKNASGDFINARLGHTAVLTRNGSIIIYGGSLFSSHGPNVCPDLAVLDTNAWIWYIPVLPKENAPPPLTFHSAALYNDYMIIAFGRATIVYDNIAINNNIYLFDTNNYLWVTEMSPPSNTTQTPTIAPVTAISTTQTATTTAPVNTTPAPMNTTTAPVNTTPGPVNTTPTPVNIKISETKK